MIKEMYYAMKHTFQRDKGICPRCGYNAFEHGFIPDEDYYCTKCHLWEPDWEKLENDLKRVMNE